MKPELVIKYGKLIDPFLKVYVENKYPDFEFMELYKVKEKVKNFRKEWRKYENLFFEGLKKINLEFKRNRIDVFIVTATDRDMSSPLIIRSRYSEKEFINVLFHELLHNLFNDINLEKEYFLETETTRKHIYVFAILTYLFKDVLNEPERTEMEKEKSNPEKNGDYYKAWKIVGKEGYKNIIEKIKTD